MKNRKLIELYGLRYTPFARMAGAVAIFIAGMFIAGNCASDDPYERTLNVEQTK